ncbi:uncharacterized protein LOC111400302 [Olea europaea var. sylvestris]|uniref:uncharacterized protein LOC111400302 n=1 Tax=Olea europaea var. sylvestris TaxID=158386 RepID=UPI000C1D0F9E|nr:uncharacterized protein LOC111400302 [Olea europaea var. sylvestris]
MPANRHSTMISNIVESVNAVTKAAKNYPIVFLLDLCMWPKLNYACDYIIGVRDMELFSVSDERSTFVVDIEQRTCTCKMLQVDLMLCPHALVVIAHTKRDPYTYCSYYYTRDAYVNAYESSIYLVGNPDEWRVPIEVEFQIVLAPNQKQSSRRQLRRGRDHLGKGKPKVRCGRCGAHGHNHRRYSSLVPLSKND